MCCNRYKRVGQVELRYDKIKMVFKDIHPYHTSWPDLEDNDLV
jgi:hypothetical protein